MENTFDLSVDIDAPTILEVKGWSTKDLISFGNYMLNRYPRKLQESFDSEMDGEIMPVTDADLRNWHLQRSL